MLLLGRSSPDFVGPYGLLTLLLWGPFDIMATLSLAAAPEAHWQHVPARAAVT